MNHLAGIGNTKPPAYLVKMCHPEPPKSIPAALPGDHPVNDPDWIRARLAEGKSVEAVAREAGCSSDSVERRMRKFGIDKPPTIHKEGLWHNVEWLREQMDAGTSQTEMARRAGCSRITIRCALNAASLREPAPVVAAPVADRPAHYWDNQPDWADCLDCPEGVLCEGCPNA